MPPILSIPLSLLIYASCSRTAAAGSTLGFALFPLPTPPLLLATPGPATFLVPTPLLPATPGSCIVFAVLTAAHVPPLTETLTYPTSFGAHNHLSSGTKHKLCQYRCYPNHSNLCPYRVCKPDPRHGLLHTTEDGHPSLPRLTLPPPQAFVTSPQRCCVSNYSKEIWSSQEPKRHWQTSDRTLRPNDNPKSSISRRGRQTTTQVVVSRNRRRNPDRSRSPRQRSRAVQSVHRSAPAATSAAGSVVHMHV